MSRHQSCYNLAMRSPSTRLIIAVASTVLEEAALAAVMLWLLPQIGVHLPPWAVTLVMAGWAAVAIIIYRIGSRALNRKPVSGLGSMVGNRGRVVKPLDPHGLVRIGGELWEAESASGHLDVDEEVTVIGQDGLKLTVTSARESH